MFRARRYRVFVFGVVLACSLSNRAEAIRYELIDGAGGFQGNHTLSGFIEFDMPCGGDCTAANVVDYTFTVTGDTNYSDSYQSPADVAMGKFNSNQPFVIAGPTSLTVDYGNPGFLSLGKAPSGPSIQWSASFDATYISFGPDIIGGWQSGGEKPLIETTIGRVVPEPGAFTVTSIGTMIFIVFVRKRSVIQ